MSILVVRRGSTSDRLAWEGDDADRPLDPLGAVQAASLVDSFADLPVSVVLSSRAIKCQQTVLPLARQAGLKVAHDPVLCEGASLQALQLVKTLGRSNNRNGTSILRCHRDMISEILRSLMLTGVRT